MNVNPAASDYVAVHWWQQLLHRFIGDWPLRGATVPFDQETFRDLFRVYPSFSDFLPLTGYDAENGVFLLDDGVSVGAAFRLFAADLDARSPERQAAFRAELDHVLRLLPMDDDEFPYVVQIYLENREPINLASLLEAATDPEIRETAFSTAWFAETRTHFDLMCAPRGLFEDARISHSGEQPKGWRAVEQQIHACIFRKAPAKEWKHRRYTSAQLFNQAIGPWLGGLEGLGLGVKRLDEAEVRAWLLPLLTPHVMGYATPTAYVNDQPLPPPEQRGAGWDFAQHLVQIPPEPIKHRDDERDRGVWKFGPSYQRYLTLHGIAFTPVDGVFTLDRQVDRAVTACPWDRLPPETVMCWTLTPRSPVVIETYLDGLQVKVENTRSDSAGAAAEQLQEARAALRNDQRIFSLQMGLYLRASSLAELDERTQVAGNVLGPVGLSPIPPRYDLIADDSFVRNLPFVYDPRFDRTHSLRARLAYTGHIAAVLPLFGRSTGTGHPCFVGWHRRDGQTFNINFYDPRDRRRVAHTVLFGPTGSGKSATAIGMALSSMAVNRPRQIIIEKGNSFGLMCAYYKSLNVQVREILFNPNRDVCYPPYVETQKALAEHRQELHLEDDDDQRSYLAEMLYMTELMITGGRTREIEALTVSDRAAIQKALINALEASELAGQPHARPWDVYQALRQMANDEQIPEIRLSMRRMADAIELWTQGPRGHFFNRFGVGFDPADDVIHIDLGMLTGSGNDDMLAVAILSLLATITAWSERNQASGRHTEVWFDEAHYISKTELTVKGFIVGTKVWRKLHTWLTFATQDFSDTSDLARQILSQAEFWVLLSMGADESRKIAHFRDLSAEEQHLITMALKEPGHYVEGVLFSEKCAPALLRFVLPALALALAQTDGEEKNRRQQLMKEHGISELAAVFKVADEITARRRQYALEEEGA
ncbi:MAG: conjugative transfer ATPase [Candidatus Competibacteraceae bacterium]|nr:conjugative transfer ATPase [Candidatus Competibacteraceae bacterium]